MSFKKPQASTPETFIPDEEEQTKINEVRKLIGPSVNRFSSQCSDASLLRYLRARNYNIKRAAKMMKETLKWRLKYKPETIQWDTIAHEAKTGKLYRANYFDKLGRTVLVIRPGTQNPNPVEDQVKYLVYCMESAISNLHQGQEQMVWLIDFRKWNMSSISVKLVRETAHVLQDHYPERLGIAILYNPPKVFESFWSCLARKSAAELGELVKPFLEPKTYKKVKFVYSDQPQSAKIMEALFDMDKLGSAFGGKNTENYEYEAYAKRMKDEEKRNKNSNDALPSDQISVTSDLQESDFLVSEISSVVTDDADSSSHYEIGSPNLEAIEEMAARLQLDCKNTVYENKIGDVTKVEG